jgi:hypothetical protein
MRNRGIHRSALVVLCSCHWRLVGFVANHDPCGRRPVDELLARLRSAVATTGQLEAEACRGAIAGLTPR